MFGGAANPFPKGRPTSYDDFGTLPGAIAPSPPADDTLPRDAAGKLAKGNMTPSLPMCSGAAKYAAFARWATATEGLTLIDQLVQPMVDAYDKMEDSVGCGSDLQRPGWEQSMRHGWAGKRLYTNADGGRITNRFFPSLSEHPLSETFVSTEPFKTLAKQSGFFPFADDKSAQTRYGIIFRGRSYVDGREAIMMDWRGFEAAWPLGQSSWIKGLFGMLIYDECRAIQTGVYNCTAVADIAIGERRHTFQEGYMPWVTKGPPSIDEYLAAIG
jgi:hypothetical protein